jgi:hypothetical protein
MRSRPSCRWPGATGFRSSLRRALASRAKVGATTACGLCVGSRLFEDPDGRRHRRGAVVADDVGARVEIRGASSLGPCQARERSRHGMPADVDESLRAEGLLRCEGPMPQNTVKRRLASWSTPHPVGKGSRDRSCAEPALGRSRLVAAGRAQERAGCHPGCLGSVDRHLRDGSSSRYSGSRDPSLGGLVRRAPAERSGATARRAAEGRAAAAARSARWEIAHVTLPRNSARPDEDGRRP